MRKIPEKIVFKGVGKAKRELRGKAAVVEIMLAQKGKNYKFDAPVVFSEDIDKNRYPLLSMRGFFDNFKTVSFSEERNKVILETKE